MDSSDSNCKEIKLVPEIKTLESAPEENSDFEIFIGNQSDNDEKPLKFIGYDPEEETRKTETKFVIPGYKEREKKPVIKWIKVRVSEFSNVLSDIRINNRTSWTPYLKSTENGCEMNPRSRRNLRNLEGAEEFHFLAAIVNLSVAVEKNYIHTNSKFI